MASPIEFRWIGGPTVELNLGSFRILTDPVFGEGAPAFSFARHPSTGRTNAPVSRVAPLPHVDMNRVTAVVLSHLHVDHFDEAARKRIPLRTRVIAPISHSETVRAAGFANVIPMEWWQGWTLTNEREILRVVAVPARHAADEALNARLGVVNGYVLSYSNDDTAFRLYWTGDTVWFDGLLDIQKVVGRCDLLVAHMGAVGQDGPFGRYTLDAAEAAALIDLFHPDTFIPIHHHTFDHYVEPATTLLRDHPAVAGHVLMLKEGESWTPLKLTTERRRAI